MNQTNRDGLANAAASVAPAPAALYDFLKMAISLECREDDVIDKDGQLIDDEKRIGLLWHEYIHYLQNVTTSCGAGVLLNWLAILIHFAQELDGENPIRAPLYRRPSLKFNREYANFLGEVQSLLGNDRKLDLSPPSNAEEYAAYLRDDQPSTAFMAVRIAGALTGIPLTGGAMIEGMAQAVQWLVETDGNWSDELLAARNEDPRYAYYDALIRYFRHHHPASNPCWPTIIAAQVCLMSDQPAYYFYIIDKHLKKGIARASDWITVKSQLLKHPKIVARMAEINARIQDLREQMAERPDSKFAKMGTCLLDVIATGIRQQTQHPELLACFQPSGELLSRLAAEFGCPPIITTDKHGAIGIPGARRVTDICFTFSAAFELVDGLYRDGLQHECPLLHKQACDGRKGTHCKTNRLKIAEGHDGRLCIMGYGAGLLGILGREVKNI